MYCHKDRHLSTVYCHKDRHLSTVYCHKDRHLSTVYRHMPTVTCRDLQGHRIFTTHLNVSLRYNPHHILSIFTGHHAPTGTYSQETPRFGHVANPYYGYTFPRNNYHSIYAGVSAFTVIYSITFLNVTWDNVTLYTFT